MAESLLIEIADWVVSAVSFDTWGVRETEKFRNYVERNGRGGGRRGDFVVIDDEVGDIFPRIEMFSKPSDSLQK